MRSDDYRPAIGSGVFTFHTCLLRKFEDVGKLGARPVIVHPIVKALGKTEEWPGAMLRFEEFHGYNAGELIVARFELFGGETLRLVGSRTLQSYIEEIFGENGPRALSKTDVFRRLFDDGREKEALLFSRIAPTVWGLGIDEQDNATWKSPTWPLTATAAAVKTMATPNETKHTVLVMADGWNYGRVLAGHDAFAKGDVYGKGVGRVMFTAPSEVKEVSSWAKAGEVFVVDYKLRHGTALCKQVGIEQVDEDQAILNFMRLEWQTLEAQAILFERVEGGPSSGVEDFFHALGEESGVWL